MKKAQKNSKKTSKQNKKAAVKKPAAPVVASKLSIGCVYTSAVPVVFDIDKLRVSHLLVTGASGSGKSYTFRVIAENLAEEKIMPIFIFDPEEEYTTLKEKYDFVVIGGEGADAPIHPQTCEITIRRLFAANMSAIFNLYSLSVEDQYLWVETAIHTLMNIPRNEWHPIAIMLDEAHLWCPEKGEGNGDARHELVNLAKRGRKRGIMNIWASQRLSSVDKSAVAELQNYLVGRTVLHTDQERTAKVLGVVRSERDDFFTKMTKLERGNFFAQGVALVSEHRRQLMKVNKAKTTHLEPGNLKTIEFPTTETIASVLEEIAAIEIPEEAAVSNVTFTTKGKVAGLYQAGSAMAVLYEHLAANNNAWLLQTELQKLIEADVVGRLKALQAHGQQYGKWSLEKLANRWRMVIAKSEPAAEPKADLTKPHAFQPTGVGSQCSCGKDYADAIHVVGSNPAAASQQPQGVA